MGIVIAKLQLTNPCAPSLAPMEVIEGMDLAVRPGTRSVDVNPGSPNIGSGVVPAWHKDVLAERLRRLDSGSEPVSVWAQAKERIRAQTKAD